jgi:hypothetical protein
LAARIEEPDYVPCERVAAAQIRSLVEIASVAAPAAIFKIVGAAVLPGDHVFDVKSGRGRREVGKPAVFTTPASPFAHKLAKEPCH